MKLNNRALLVLGVSAVLLTGCATGSPVTTESTPAASSPSQTPSQTPTVTQSATASPTPTGSGTQIEHRDWLALSVAGADTYRGGEECFESGVMWNRPGAYRCFTANSEIFDPCFSDGKRMLCPDDPFEDGVRLLTVKKVPPRSDLANQSDLPWGIELPSGNQCYLMDGHTGFRGDARRNYKCDSGWIWGDPEVSDKTWLVQWTLHNNQTDPLQTTRVVRVVY